MRSLLLVGHAPTHRVESMLLLDLLTQHLSTTSMMWCQLGHWIVPPTSLFNSMNSWCLVVSFYSTRLVSSLNGVLRGWMIVLLMAKLLLLLMGSSRPTKKSLWIE